ncbi:MAG: dihydrolipoyl dehydrogenase [Gammaproteobacteria bacterium]|nr:MAG: dihydrolipoyl dehydrogenase [Gammaproteobacteria bacterium]
MSGEHRVTVPDLGDFDEVEIIEVLVAEGDEVSAEQGLVTLETDKAAMDVPSPVAGRVRELLVSVGERVGKGSEILVLETAGSAGDREDKAADGAGEGAAADTAEEQAPPDAARKVEPKASSKGAEPASASETPALPKADRQTPLLVLGAGPGGYTAAFRAADLGMDVTLVERWPVLGGVCLNVGCIPSKALLHAARVIDEAGAFADHGLRFGSPEIDLDRLRAWKDGVVERLVGGLGTLAEKRGVQVVRGTGRFLGQRLLEVDGAEGKTTIAFEQCIIAAGSEPVRLPGWPEDPRIIDSTGALELESLPRRMLVVGGGIIGLEMATVYAALGVEVDIVEMTDGLMPGADRDLVRPLEKRLRRLCGRIMLGTRVTDVRVADAAVEVSFEGAAAPSDDPVAYERVLVAVGRRANGDAIDADAAGVEIDERGLIKVDRQMRSNLAHIFAIGDLAGGPMLAHKAVHEGKVAAEVAAGQKRAFDARVIPSVAYTDPEVAWVGLTETEAKAEGIRYEKGVFPWAASGRSLAMGRDEGLTKLLFDPKTHRVIGGGIVGTNAGDLIAEVALAIEMGADAADIGLTIHPHPTLSETVAMAAEAFEGTLTDLLPPKRGR